MAVAQ